MTRHMVFSLAALAALGANTVQAAPLFTSDFSTFSDGALVGQGGWLQTGASATAPLTVASGQVVVPAVTGTTTVDNQDAYKSVGTAIATPASGTTSVYFGVDVSVQSAVAGGPSYFIALDNNADGSGFDNYRVAAQASGAGYVLAARITGQGTDPFSFGSTVLNFNQTYRLVGKMDLVAGAGNDVFTLYIDPTQSDLSLETPYLTHVIGAGATDATAIGALNISQFHSSTSGSSAFTIGWAAMSLAPADVVPEPSTAGLAALVLAAAATKRRVQR